VIYLGYSKHDLLDYIKDIFLGLFVTLNATYEEPCTENAKVLENLVIYWIVKCKQEMKSLMKIVFSTRHTTYEEPCTENAKVLENLVIYWIVKCKQEMKLLMKIVFSTRHTIRCVVTVNIMSM